MVARRIRVGAASAASTTWDSGGNKGSGIDLSNGNLTATSNSTSNAYDLSTTTRSGGKYVFEVRFGGSAIGATSWYIAIQDASASFPNGYVYYQDTDSFINNVSTGGQAPARPVTGDYLMCAIDLTNNKMWVKHDTDTDWNGSPTDDPATNTGGINIAAAVISGNFYILFNIQDNVGQAITLNAGQSAFHFTAPAGFSSWG